MKQNLSRIKELQHSGVCDLALLIIDLLIMDVVNLNKFLFLKLQGPHHG